MIINTQNLDSLRVTFQSLYDSAFLAAGSYWQEIAMPTTSAGKENKYGWLGQFPQMREWLGDRVLNNLVSHDFALLNKKFESTVEVKAEDIEDDMIGEYAPLFSLLGDTAARHPDNLIFSLLNNGFSTACYDGQYFFDTDHPVLDANGNTQSVSNTGGGSSNPWFVMDASRPIKPLIFQKRRDYRFRALDKPEDDKVFTKDRFTYGLDSRVNAGFGLWQLAYGSKQTLDADAYASGRQNLLARTGDGGQPLGLKPSVLVVGPSNEQAGLEIIKAERNAAGATNVYQNSAKLVVCPYLA